MQVIPKTQYQQIGQQKIAYIQLNPELPDTIVFVHGHMSDKTWWLETIQSLKGRYHIIAVDQRGFGESTNNKPAMTLQEQATDLVIFCQRKGLKEINLVGWSFGGLVSQKIAEITGLMVKNLVLVCSVGHLGLKLKTSQGVCLSTLQQIQTNNKVVLMRQCLANKNYDFVRTVIFDTVIFTYMQKIPELRKRYLVQTGFNQRNYIQVLYILANSEVDLSKIKAKVLIVNGKDDLVITADNIQPTIQKLHDLKHQMKLVVYEDAAHMVPIEQTKRFTRDLQDFIMVNNQKSVITLKPRL